MTLAIALFFRMLNHSRLSIRAANRDVGFRKSPINVGNTMSARHSETRQDGTYDVPAHFRISRLASAGRRLPKNPKQDASLMIQRAARTYDGSKHLV
jgi:hypothetical protein